MLTVLAAPAMVAVLALFAALTLQHLRVSSLLPTCKQGYLHRGDRCYRAGRKGPTYRDGRSWFHPERADDVMVQLPDNLFDMLPNCPFCIGCEGVSKDVGEFAKDTCVCCEEASIDNHILM